MNVLIIKCITNFCIGKISLNVSNQKHYHMNDRIINYYTLNTTPKHFFTTEELLYSDVDIKSNIDSKERVIPILPSSFISLSDISSIRGNNVDYLDLDYFFLQRNNFFTLKNKNKLIQNFKNYYVNLLHNTDIVLYSLTLGSTNDQIALKINREIIEYISGICHIYVGGLHIKKSYKKHNISYVTGSNLDELDISIPVKLQKLSEKKYKIKKGSNLNIKIKYNKTYKEIFDIYNYNYCNISTNVDINENYIGFYTYTLCNTTYCKETCVYCNNSSLVNDKPKYIGLNNFHVLLSLYNCGFNSCAILDCNIFSFPKVITTLERYLYKHKMDYNFMFGVQLNQLNEKNISRLKNIGMKICYICVESLQSKVQKLIRKQIDIIKLKDILQILTDNNIGTILNFIPCLPYSTIEELDLIYNFYFENKENISCISASPFFVSGDIRRNPNKYKIKFINNLYYEKGHILNFFEKKRQYSKTIETINKYDIFNIYMIEYIFI